ncbi:MAG: hypothetical protein N2652_11780 [Kiritimatiellae bacterium]|nr:hypothetical protein [Kiritimatiellia bacterium]
MLLRPYQDTGGRWHALVIFVEAHKWPVERPVYLSHQRRVNNQVQLHSETRRVRLDLYEKMKQDPKLSDFR